MGAARPRRGAIYTGRARAMVSRTDVPAQIVTQGAWISGRNAPALEEGCARVDATPCGNRRRNAAAPEPKRAQPLRMWRDAARLKLQSLVLKYVATDEPQI